MIIGKGDTPTFPASDLWSSDVRFTLTKSVCKTNEFGDSAAGCHGERSELGDASRETSPTLLPSGRWQDNQTPIAFVLKLLFGYASCKCHFGTMLAGVYHSIQKHLWGCAYRERADYTSLF